MDRNTIRDEILPASMNQSFLAISSKGRDLRLFFMCNELLVYVSKVLVTISVLQSQ